MTRSASSANASKIASNRRTCDRRHQSCRKAREAILKELAALKEWVQLPSPFTGRPGRKE